MNILLQDAESLGVSRVSSNFSTWAVKMQMSDFFLFLTSTEPSNSVPGCGPGGANM